jgi:hypothetical protein
MKASKYEHNPGYVSIKSVDNLAEFMWFRVRTYGVLLWRRKEPSWSVNVGEICVS